MEDPATPTETSPPDVVAPADDPGAGRRRARNAIGPTQGVATGIGSMFGVGGVVGMIAGAIGGPLSSRLGGGESPDPARRAKRAQRAEKRAARRGRGSRA